MRLRDELLDPLGLMFAGIAGGVAAVAGAAMYAVPIGIGVYVTKVVTGLLTDRAPRTPEARLLPVLSGSEEDGWLKRSQAAERSFRDVARSVRPGPVSERVRSFGDETEAALESIRRLAGQASAVALAMARIDVRRCAAERDRLVAALSQPGPGRVRREQERAVEALQSQVDSYTRLYEARSALVARLESGTIGLEGLVARLAEVVALAETAGTSAGGATRVEELAAELEGLRAGLVEVEGVTEQALGELHVPDAGTVGRRESRRAR